MSKLQCSRNLRVLEERMELYIYYFCVEKSKIKPGIHLSERFPLPGSLSLSPRLLVLPGFLFFIASFKIFDF